jgi:hypothetical protein
MEKRQETQKSDENYSASALCQMGVSSPIAPFSIPTAAYDRLIVYLAYPRTNEGLQGDESAALLFQPVPSFGPYHCFPPVGLTGFRRQAHPGCHA